jgi:hypothetical protein
MELTELRSTWQILEHKLERSNQLNLAILRRQWADAARATLRPLRWNQTFQILFGVLFIVLAAFLWSTKPTVLPVILAGVIIHAYGIGCIITASMVFASMRRINFAAPVVEVQQGLAKVRRAYGICVLVAGLSWWFLWIPLLMLLLALVHVNLYAHAPSVIWIGTAIGVAGIFATRLIYSSSQRSSNLRWRSFVERLAFGESLLRAQQQLSEARSFEEESK